MFAPARSVPAAVRSVFGAVAEVLTTTPVERRPERTRLGSVRVRGGV
jgi:hypothetical protein